MVVTNDGNFFLFGEGESGQLGNRPRSVDDLTDKDEDHTPEMLDENKFLFYDEHNFDQNVRTFHVCHQKVYVFL